MYTQMYTGGSHAFAAARWSLHLQKRIPADPIRIALPPSGARHARRLALQLAAAFDLETQKLRMSKPEDISREALIDSA